MNRARIFLSVVLLFGVCVGAAQMARAQETAPQPAPAATNGTKPPPKEVTIYLHQSAVIKPPWLVKRVNVTDPKVANAQVLTPSQLLVWGNALGTTDVILWSETEEVWRTRIVVEADVIQLKAMLAKMLPESRLDVSQMEGLLIVQGALARAEQTAELHRFLDQTGLKYVDLTRVAGCQQVQLNVRVAEVSRTLLREMNINIFHTGHDFFFSSQIGSSAGTPLNPISIGVPAGTPAGRDLPFQFTAPVVADPNSVTLFGGFPTADVQYFIRALAENQYLRLLAEPSLVALSGEEASFLAGGEYPIPVVQGAGAGGGGTSISVEYRPYGVLLRFRPVVLGDGTIRLYVAPEVSDLSFDVSSTTINGFSIPATITRKAATTLELKNGQTFAMAGLISSSTSASTSRSPFLGDLPVLGAFFRSVRYRTGETELVVLVTVHLVEPLSSDSLPPPPGALHSVPNDWELYMDAKIEGAASPQLSPADAEWLRKLGFAELRGPGGWRTYGRPTVESCAVMQPVQPAEAIPPAVNPAPAPVTKLEVTEAK